MSELLSNKEDGMLPRGTFGLTVWLSESLQRLSGRSTSSGADEKTSNGR
jgi:hypothetical protein